MVKRLLIHFSPVMKILSAKIFFCKKETVDSIDTQYEMIKVNGCAIPMQVDTRSSVSAISATLWEQIGRPKLSTSKNSLEAYDRHVLTRDRLGGGPKGHPYGFS